MAEERAEAVAGFMDTAQHAVALWNKATMLQAQARQAVEVMVGLTPYVDYQTLSEGYATIKAAEVVGRKPLADELRRRRVRGHHTHLPGQIVRRSRAASEPWPIAPAWVYILVGEGSEVLYVGKSRRPRFRLPHHSRRGIPWTVVELIACGSEAEALQIEGDLIFQHQPPWNIADTQQRRRVVT